MSKVLGIIQARTSSSRLPGKILEKISGVESIIWQWRRCLKSKLVDQWVMATSDEASDDVFCQLLDKHKIPYYRGSLNNVLERFYHCAQEFTGEHIVRITGDCPLHDAQVIDRVIDAHLQGSFDYTSNTMLPTYPDGLDTEVMSFKALKRAFDEAQDPFEQEHVTPYLYRHPEIFSLHNVSLNQDLSKVRLTLDTSNDLLLVKAIYQHFGHQRCDFGFEDVMNLLKQKPELALINYGLERNYATVSGV